MDSLASDRQPLYEVLGVVSVKFTIVEFKLEVKIFG